ncbi:MAG: hypothetical protein WC665_06095 [Sulfurimonas sp.]|jgi:hypothetical protein
MKYIIDMIDDMRENIQNAGDYTLLAMLLKEESPDNFQNAGEKIVTSFYIDNDSKQLQLGFLDGNVTTRTLLDCVNSLEMQMMMYEIVVKVSVNHPLISVVGFGENHEQKQYTFFVMI